MLSLSPVRKLILTVVLLVTGVPTFTSAQSDMINSMGGRQGMMGNEMMGKRSSSGAGTSGAKAFAQVCSMCHALPSPNAHTAAEWPPIVERMRKRSVASGVNLDYRTVAKIDAFLRAESRK
jgi:cytochrome c5